MDDVFAVKVHQSFGDSFENLSQQGVVALADEVAQTAVRTVFEDDGEVLFFVEEKELSGFEDVGVIESDVKFGFLFGIVFVVLGDRDEFESVLVLVNGFDVVNFAKTALSEFAKDLVVMDLIWHHVIRK